MIFAELQGKLGQHHSRAHERAEDVLTSTVFGLLRYLPLTDWLPLMAARIRPIEKERGPKFLPDGTWLDVGAVHRCDLQLWRRRSPHGEPDVLMSLFDVQGQLLHLLVIEVKLYSPKSGAAKVVSDEQAASNGKDDDEEELADIDKDQLVRYWRYLCEDLDRWQASDKDRAAGAPAVKASLVYLTAHATPPTDELLISLKAAGTDMRLGWLSWFDLWHVVHAAAKGDKSLPAKDLEKLLSHKGFRCFVGFRGTETPPEPGQWSGASVRFWRRRGWFRQEGPQTAESAGFWQGARSSH